MSAQGFRVLRRLEGWGFGGRKAVSAQGLGSSEVGRPGFPRLQGSECARLQGSSEVGRLGFRRPQGSACARLEGSSEVGRLGFLRLQRSECARLKGSSEVGRLEFWRLQGSECGASVELTVELPWNSCLQGCRL